MEQSRSGTAGIRKRASWWGNMLRRKTPEMAERIGRETSEMAERVGREARRIVMRQKMAGPRSWGRLTRKWIHLG